MTEVKLHYFLGRGSTTSVAVKLFLPFLNECGNSKVFELYLIFQHGNRVIYFRHHDSAVVLSADDLEDHVNMTYK